MSTDYEKYTQEIKKKNNYSAKSFESLLLAEGYTFRNQTGSHKIFKHAKKELVSYPYGNIVAVGTLRKELKKIYPAWNVKPQNVITEETSGYTLTESMFALCEELELNPDELTQEDYNTLVELTEVS
jgi:predicted RNA binding protein YcfA (HicA-like mRNA interferase family)